MSHFEVGKKVIAIANSQCGNIKRGNIFPLNGIRKSQCKCTDVELDIGLECNTENFGCPICDIWDIKATGNILWKASRLFAPYDDSLSDVSIDAILDEMNKTEKEKI